MKNHPFTFCDVGAETENHTSILPADPCLALSIGALGEVFNLEGRRNLSLPNCFLVTSCSLHVWLLSTVCDFLSSSWWLPVYFLCDFCLLCVGSYLLPGVCVCLLSITQSCPTLCNPMDYNPPGPSVHGMLQVRILEWVAISFSRGSSWPRDRTQICFPLCHLREALRLGSMCLLLLLTLTARVPSWSIWIQIRAGTQNFEKGHRLTAVC